MHNDYSPWTPHTWVFPSTAGTLTYDCIVGCIAVIGMFVFNKMLILVLKSRNICIYIDRRMLLLNQLQPINTFMRNVRHSIRDCLSYWVHLNHFNIGVNGSASYLFQLQVSGEVASEPKDRLVNHLAFLLALMGLGLSYYSVRQMMQKSNFHSSHGHRWDYCKMGRGKCLMLSQADRSIMYVNKE